jgi:hypothetical protein
MKIMNDEMGRIWKEAAIVYFKPLFQFMLGGAEGNHVKLQSLTFLRAKIRTTAKRILVQKVLVS